MYESVESLLDELERTLTEQAEYLKSLRGRALFDHAGRSFEVLFRLEDKVSSFQESPRRAGLEGRLRRLRGLLRLNLALLSAEQRRQRFLVPMLRPEASVYDRQGHMGGTVESLGGHLG
jgi:hypothetical protein